MIEQHLTLQEDVRDQAWDEKFFKLFSESTLRIIATDPQQGPDGWPYLMTEIIIGSAAASESVDSAQKILHWLSTRGIGMVVNPHRTPYPDFVLTYGMIWSFRETGLFNKYQSQDSAKELRLDNLQTAVFGAPTSEFLPQYVRKILKDFFLDQAVFDPKVLMISKDGKNYDLCFSLESLGNPTQSEHNGILEALSWFMPPHYSLVLISEKNLPPFASLSW